MSDEVALLGFVSGFPAAKGGYRRFEPVLPGVPTASGHPLPFSQVEKALRDDAAGVIPKQAAGPAMGPASGPLFVRGGREVAA